MKDNINKFFSKLNGAFVCAFVTGAIALIILFCCSERNNPAMLILAFAAFGVGSFIGFLFGVPRTLQKAATADSRTEIQENTNLEQISDWLTKILVGVGLTQIDSIKHNLYILSFQAGSAISSSGKPSDANTMFAGALLVFFALNGFLVSYLWTRLSLTALQKQNLKGDMLEQDENDKIATERVFKQLNHSSDVPDIRVDELYEILKRASGRTISEIYIMVVNFRKANWKKNDECVAKTIPVFEALILLDSENNYPENYSQLGYALKDKKHPEYMRAIENFSKAITEFKRKEITNGLSMIYFNRAICYINLDREFQQGLPSDSDSRKRIEDDIIEAEKDSIVKEMIKSSAEITQWKTVNQLNEIN